MPNTPWYLSPAIRDAVLADHRIDAQRDHWGKWEYSVVVTPAFERMKAAYEAAFKGAAPADYAACGIYVIPELLAAALSGERPYEWTAARRWPEAVAAAAEIRALALGIAA